MMNNFAEVDSEHLQSCIYTAADQPESEPEVGHCNCTLHKTLHSSLDVWEYEAGEFEWKVECDQTIWVLSGHGKVFLPDGREVAFYPGATCFFNKGLKIHWEVDDALRFVAACGS